MIPKSGKSPADSRKSVGIHEFAALARSSLNGISQAMRDHVTKPTSLAQGRVAHLIEWKGWPKPANPPPAAAFSSYCHLTEGEKEARFAAGVAEQFAIAEAKLRAWASVDDEDEEDSNDEDSPTNGPTQTACSRSSDAVPSNPVDGARCQPDVEGPEASHRPLCYSSSSSGISSSGSGSGSISSGGIGISSSSSGSSSSGISSSSSSSSGIGISSSGSSGSGSGSGSGSSSGSGGGALPSGRPASHSDPHSSRTNSPTLPSDCMSPFLEKEEEEEEEEEKLDCRREKPAHLRERHGDVCIHHKPEWRPRPRSGRFDSCYSTSRSESPGEEDEEDEDEEGSVFHEFRAWHSSRRSFFSDRASSGVASFDEEERDEVEEKKDHSV